MKKTALFIVVVLSCAAVYSQGQSPAKPAQAPAKPTLAVLELSGSGTDTAELSGLTNRLRAELFETQKFTVVERGEMDAILKEQGFQQTGCTDAACAVQVGQLLNAEYMIVGTVDHVGRVYSVNIRQVNVASGAITNNVKSDCADCTIEDVMLKTVRTAARRIAGVEASAETEVVTELKGRKMMKYKRYTGGEAGTLAITVKPTDATIIVDGETYGSGNMVIDYVPVGQHTVKATCPKMFPATKKIEVSFDKTTECSLNPRKSYICIEPSASFMSPSLSRNFNGVFILDTIPYDTLRISGSGDTWYGPLGSLSIWLRNYSRHVFGLSLAFASFSVDKPVTRSRPSAPDTIFEFKQDKIGLGLLFAYYYNIINLRNIFLADAGVQAGAELFSFQTRAKEARSDSILGGHGLNAQFSTSENGPILGLFGGPSLSLLIGCNPVYFKFTYTGMIGEDFNGNKFAYKNQTGLGLLFQL